MSEEFKSALDILSKDGQNPAEVKALSEELFEIEMTVKRELDKGLPPDEAGPVRALLTGCGAAREVAEKLSM
ncbi:hypothetical protein C4J81_17885 [Deltaproteobacteria bacterium Smac51]|nr:hypothetical protein C4J81_17885 [Deltaproteobacteria bacterium Smac51]